MTAPMMTTITVTTMTIASATATITTTTIILNHDEDDDNVEDDDAEDDCNNDDDHENVDAGDEVANDVGYSNDDDKSDEYEDNMNLNVFQKPVATSKLQGKICIALSQRSLTAAAAAVVQAAAHTRTLSQTVVSCSKI